MKDETTVEQDILNALVRIGIILDERLPKEEPAWMRDGIIPTLQGSARAKEAERDDPVDAARQEFIAARVRLLDAVLAARPRHLPVDQGDGQQHWCKRCGRTAFGELVGEVGK